MIAGFVETRKNMNSKTKITDRSLHTVVLEIAIADEKMFRKRFKLTEETMRAEKSLSPFPVTHRNVFRHFFLASFFTAGSKTYSSNS